MNTAANWILGYVSSKYSCFHDFSSIWTIIHIVGTPILSRTNVDCVLLASILNSIFVLLEVLSQFLGTVIIRGVFRTLQTWWSFLSKYVTTLTSVILFWSAPEFTSDHDTVFFSNQNPFQSLFFVENWNEKEDMSYNFTFS